SRLMALALRFQDLLSHATVLNHAQLAELGHVSRVRVCQILMLNNLAPAIQQSLLFLPKTARGRDRITEAACAVWRSSSTGTRRSSCFVPASSANRSEATSSQLQTVDALAVALKGAHLPALLGQVAGDEPTHRMGLPPGLVSDLVQRGAFRPA